MSIEALIVSVRFSLSTRNHTLRVDSGYCKVIVLHHYTYLINFRFLTTERGELGILSTYGQRILSACGAPAAVWNTLSQGATSSFHSFIDTRDGNTVFRKYSAPFHFLLC